MMELSAQLALCGLDNREQLLDCSIITHGQQRRSTVSLSVGRAGGENVCVVTLFKPPWPVYPSLFTLLSSHGGRNYGRNRCSSPVWKRFSTNANASGEAQTIEQLWEDYFADPSQWWDNRVDKSNPKSPDFKHKITRKALWVDGWSNPPWVKAMLKSVIGGKLQPPVSYCTRDSHGTAQPNRPLKNNNVTRIPRPTSMREWRHSAQVDDIGTHLQNASTSSEAVATFKKYVRQGITVNSYKCGEVLQKCFKQKDIVSAKQVQVCIVESGMEQNTYVANNLLRVFIRCGRLQDARQVFDRLLKKNVVSWNIMIGGHAQHDHAEGAIEVFDQMRLEGAQPNEITYLSILKACASPGALKWGKEVHAHIRHGGFASDVRVGTALVDMYAKSGSINDARLVFDRMVERNIVTWTVMIGGLSQHGFGHEAYSLFLKMQRGGIVPNATTYVSILSPCASAGGLEWVKEVHSHALRAGLELDLRVGTALVNMYAKSGSIDDARLVFDRMVERDVVTWTVMIGGLAQHGCGHEALLLFGQMNAKGVRPNGVTFVATLSACSHVGLVNKGRHLFLAMTEDHGIKPALEHYTCMVDVLGRAGHLEEAKVFILNMPLEPDGATWRALLGACRTYGNVELAEFAAKECLKLEPKNAAAYVLLSNIYAAAGKWDQVSSVRTMMQDRGIHKEPGCSWIQVDNEIHRFIGGVTSHPEAREIYAELKILTEEMKAEGYIPDTRHVLHNMDKEDKELALCSHCQKLAIAYGLMRTAPGDPIHIFKNLRVCSDCHTATKFISKVTGREIVARDAYRFHHFKDGVCTCGDYW